MRLCHTNWKAVHFDDRTILRTDRNLYTEGQWWQLVYHTQVEPMEQDGHYRVVG